jgi:hypothetical protein
MSRTRAPKERDVDGGKPAMNAQMQRAKPVMARKRLAFSMGGRHVGLDLQKTGSRKADGGLSTPGRVTPREEVQNRRQPSSPLFRA